MMTLWCAPPEIKCWLRPWLYIADSEQKALIAADKERNASAISLESRAQLGKVEAEMTGTKKDYLKLQEKLASLEREQGKMEQLKKK